ncbi:FG-GAP-like repeat-containing protein [Streptomyces sp. NPDC056144]|uniref:FG-GAP-like repeat-containing protein n=1 Tax=unclassified Streptomyces TaxID=2593676 RepID=UPI0035E1B5C3
MTARLTFLAWVREGLAARTTTPDPLSGPLPAHATVHAGVRVDQQPATGTDLRLYGPGAVIGIDRRQVIRSEPPEGTSRFEPNHLVCVEFDEPGLPWEFTPAAPDAQGRLRPWLVLVVVPADRAVLVQGSPLPTVDIKDADLPDLAESWAWAHAQVATVDGESVADALADLPERTLSRLVCPTRLRPGTRYLAVVVPAFDAGTRAGLGTVPTEADDAPLRPAWENGARHAYLPVYHHWEFATGPEGDFEALARRIKPAELPSASTLGPLELGPAGVPGLPNGTPTVTLSRGGALRPPGSAPTPWPLLSRQAYEQLVTRLAGHPADRLGPPLYGSAQAAVDSVEQAPAWLRALSLDPRHRVAAALGAQVVRDQQEELMSAAWEQAADAQRANQALRQTQLARELSLSQYRRRFSGESAGARAGAVAGSVSGALSGAAAGVTRLLQLSGPVLDQVDLPGGHGSAADAWKDNSTVGATLSAPFRRATRPNGPLGRRLGGAQADVAEAVASGAVTATPPLAPPDGTVRFDDVAGSRIRLDLVDPDGLGRAPRWWDPATVGIAAAAPETGTAAEAGTAAETGVAEAAPTPTAIPIPQAIPMNARVYEDNTLFVGGQDRKLYTLAYDGTDWRWQHHWDDKGGRAYAPLGKVTRTSSMMLYDAYGIAERRWNGDQWTWLTKASPSMTSLSGSLVMRQGRSVIGWVWTGMSGNLFGEARRTLNSWEWSTRSPGTRLYYFSGGFGAPQRNETRCWVLGGNDQTTSLWQFDWVYRRTGGSGWEWVEHGAPTGAPVQSLGPSVDDNKLFLTTRDGRLFERYYVNWTWFWVDHGTPPGTTCRSILGGASGSPDVFVSGANGRLYQRTWTGAAWQWRDVGLPPGTGSVRPVAWMPSRRTVFAATADSPYGERLWSASEANGVWTWVANHGVPADQRGKGGHRDEPVARPEWKVPLGFMSDLVVAGIGSPQGENVLHHRVGRDLGFEGEVRGGWAARQTKPGWTGGESAGLGIAVGQVTAAARPDLVAAWIDGPAGPNRLYYQLGRELDRDGVVTGGWSTARTAPVPVNDFVYGADAALADLDGDGRPELIVAYAAPKGLYYRIGWGLDTDGKVTRGWTDSLRVPWSGGPVTAVGVALADTNDDGLPDLVVAIARTEGATSRVQYTVGRRINARGLAAGGWTSWRSVGGGPLPPSLWGLGLAVTDITGSRYADLIVLHLHDGPGESPNQAFFRLGEDFDRIGGGGRQWSVSRPVPDWPDPYNQGTAVAVADLDPALTERRKSMGDAFIEAAVRHQKRVIAAMDLTPGERPRPVDRLPDVARQVRSGLDPAAAITSALAARLSVPLAPPPAGLAAAAPPDPLRQLSVTPRFDRPMYEALRDLGQELLLPGVSAVPPDSAVLLEPDPAFIEAFLTGLNHEMSRELLWRRYPTDPRATFFHRFWDNREVPGAAPDIGPIAGWAPAGPLGSHGSYGADCLVLVLRGELLRRYPGTSVHLRRATWEEGTGRRVPGSETRPPRFSGRMEPDLWFFGLPVREADARGGGDDPGWYVVLEQPPTDLRFGLDDPADSGSVTAGTGGVPASWSDLHWGSLAPDAVAAERLRHVPATSVLSTLRLGGLEWGRNSAHLAQILLRRPFRVIRHASALLPQRPAALREDPR